MRQSLLNNTRSPVFLVALLTASVAGRAPCAERAPWWNNKWERRVSLDVEKGVAGPLKSFPLAAPAGFLDLPRDTNWKAVRLIGPSGVEVPVQIDDLDGDGKIAGQDELVFLGDLDQDRTRFYLYFSADKGAAAGKGAVDGGIKASFDSAGRPDLCNSAIRISEGKFAFRLAESNRWVEILTGDGSLAFDAYNYGGSTVKGWRARIVANGPVRVVARRTSEAVVPTARAAGRAAAPAQVVHEWRMYRARNELFVSSRIRNLVKGRDVLKVARGWSWLDVRPGGQYTAEDYWSAVVKPWKTWTKSMAGGPTKKRAADGLTQGIRLAEEWIDVHTDGPSQKPRVNVGLVFHPRSAKSRLWAGERDRRCRLVVVLGMNWPKIPPKGSLWVGFWIVPHQGAPREVRNFWEATRKVDVVPGAIETRPSDAAAANR